MQLGREAGYNQWIIVNIVVIKEEDLKAAGFYNDEDPNARISHEPAVVWADATKDLSADQKVALAKKVICPSSEDWNRLSECVLENIQYVLENRDKLVLSDREVVRKLPQFDGIVDETSRTQMEALKDNEHPATIQSDNSNQQHCFSIPRNHIPDGITDEIGGFDQLMVRMLRTDTHKTTRVCLQIIMIYQRVQQSRHSFNVRLLHLIGKWPSGKRW